MEILVAGKDPKSLARIKEMIGPVTPGVITISSIDALSRTLNEHTPLLVLLEDFIDLTFLHLGSDFLHHTSCLALVENFEEIPEVLSNYESVDILEDTAPRPIILRKITFHLHGKTQRDTIRELTEKLNSAQQSMQDHLQILDSLATRDGLTGLYNRRHFTKIFNQMFSAARKRHEDFSLLLIDIDYFSQINKSFGQSFGDFVLNEISARITTIFRNDDLTFRFGGEDFSVLLPDTDIKKALQLAEEFRSECAGKSFTDGHISHDITVSIGCSSLESCYPRDPDELVTMAEMALFAAKSDGRNRVMDYQDTIDYRLHDSQRNFLSLKNNLSKILDKTKSSTISCLQLLARDLGDDKGQQHVSEVSSFITLLCSNLRIPETIARTFGNAIALHSSIRSLLHNEIITKSDSLNEMEREIIQEFPYRLLELTELFDYFTNERAILLSYGERYDGTGYPDGLRGDQIPLGARIFNIVDAFTAMNSDRPYRKKLPPEHIISELKAGAGTQFDPFLVYKTLDLVAEHNLLEIDQEHLDQAKLEISTAFPHIFP